MITPTSQQKLPVKAEPAKSGISYDDIMREARWLQHMDGDHASEDIFKYVQPARKNLGLE